jgi:hypothetical protein
MLPPNCQIHQELLEALNLTMSAGLERRRAPQIAVPDVACVMYTDVCNHRHTLYSDRQHLPTHCANPGQPF